MNPTHHEIDGVLWIVIFLIHDTVISVSKPIAPRQERRAICSPFFTAVSSGIGMILKSQYFYTCMQ